MKHIILALGAVVLGTSALGQTLVGGKVGLNYTLIGTKYDPEPDPKPEAGSGVGFHIGAYVQLSISEHVGVRPEVLYSLRGFQDDRTITYTETNNGIATMVETKYSDKAAYSYIEIPLLLAFQATDNFGFHVGPGFGLLGGGKVKSSRSITTSETSGGTTTVTTSEQDLEFSGSDVTDGLRKVEIAAVVGLIFETDKGVNFGVRYWRGLASFNEDTTPYSPSEATVKSYTNLFQLSLGYSFIKAD